MRNKTQAINRTSIPYVKQFRKYVGSIAGCILFQQLDFWFSSKPDGFYKFLEKPQSEHPQYKDGDSWNEELEITPDEFRTAFDAIAVRYKSKKEYDSSPDKFQGKFYCSYYDRVARLTWYFRNHDLVDGFLDIVYKGLDATVFLETGIDSSRNQDGQFLETGIASSRNWDQPLLETGIASSNLYTELTTDLTTNKRADDFFAIAPSSQDQENSFPVQTTPRIEETPTPPTPASPSVVEDKPKKAVADPMGDRFRQGKPKHRYSTLVSSNPEWQVLDSWCTGKDLGDFKPSLIKATIAHLKKWEHPFEAGDAINCLSGYIKRRDLDGFEGRVKEALKLEAAEAIASQQAPVPTDIPQQTAPRIDPIAHKRIVEEARRRVAQQAA